MGHSTLFHTSILPCQNLSICHQLYFSICYFLLPDYNWCKSKTWRYRVKTDVTIFLSYFGVRKAMTCNANHHGEKCRQQKKCPSARIRTNDRSMKQKIMAANFSSIPSILLHKTESRESPKFQNLWMHVLKAVGHLGRRTRALWTDLFM